MKGPITISLDDLSAADIDLIKKIKGLPPNIIIDTSLSAYAPAEAKVFVGSIMADLAALETTKTGKEIMDGIKNQTKNDTTITIIPDTKEIKDATVSTQTVNGVLVNAPKTPITIKYHPDSTTHH